MTDQDLPAGTQMFWTGTDGTRWALSDPASPVRLKAGGTKGLSTPPVQAYRQASPARPGARWRSARTLEREVFLPVSVSGGASRQAWLTLDALFWAGLDPERTGVLELVQPSGATRRLVCRFSDDGDHAYDVDPTLQRRQRYALTLMADEQPYWQGQVVRRTFTTSPGVPFFGDGQSGTGHGGPPFHISSGSNLAQATMTNPGDVPAGITWRLWGPFEAATVGVGDTLIDVPFPVAAGKGVLLDPVEQTAVDTDGADRTAELGEVGYASIPAGTTTPLSLAITGTGSVEAALVPLYRRAW